METKFYGGVGPFMKSKMSTQKIMFILMLGLLTLTGLAVYNQFTNTSQEAGIRSLIIFAISVGTAVASEAIWFSVVKGKRGKDLTKAMNASFPIITALIFALTLPVWTPYYVAGLGSFVAIVLGKLIFGGFGFNVLNPAIVGRGFVALTFSTQISTGTELAKKFIALAGDNTGVNSTAGSTLIGNVASNGWLPELKSFVDIKWLDVLFGFRQGAMGETFGLAILFIAALFIILKVIDWRITVAMIASVFGLALVYGLMKYNYIEYATDYALLHTLSGGLLFGAVFMATDPVTSPTNPTGKWIYGIFIGGLTFMIRVFASMPEAVAFAILFGNIITSQLDKALVRRQHIQKAWRVAPVAITFALALGASTGVAIMKSTDSADRPVDVLEPEAQGAHTILNSLSWVGLPRELVEDEAYEFVANKSYATYGFKISDYTSATITTPTAVHAMIYQWKGYYTQQMLIVLDQANGEKIIEVKFRNSAPNWSTSGNAGGECPTDCGQNSIDTMMKALVGKDADGVAAISQPSDITGASYTVKGFADFTSKFKQTYTELKGGF